MQALRSVDAEISQEDLYQPDALDRLVIRTSELKDRAAQVAAQAFQVFGNALQSVSLEKQETQTHGNKEFTMAANMLSEQRLRLADHKNIIIFGEDAEVYSDDNDLPHTTEMVTD